ncbi:MAG: DNA repair protein [Lachnospiraceae bacterium]|nr:DNA repair protein [Lachnospiraceae bacterium]
MRKQERDEYADKKKGAAMTDKELHKLKRAELLEMLIEQQKELLDVKQRLEEAEKKLKSRDLVISRAGSIAEAALQLNGVFEAAQKAADQYLANVKKLAGETGGSEQT